MNTFKPSIPNTENFKQRRLRKKAVKRALMTEKERMESFKKSRKSYFEYVDWCNKRKKKTDLQYAKDIEYIQSLAGDEIPVESKEKILMILRNHKNVFIKKTARLKNHAISCISFCRKQKQKEEEAINRIIGGDDE